MLKLALAFGLLFSVAASAGYNPNNPYCNIDENFAGPDCWGTPAYLRKGPGDTRNEDYSYCNVDEEHWASGYFECRDQAGRWVHAPAPRYMPYCDGSERIGTTDWWACHSSSN